MSDIWNDVLGYEGFYAVSKSGVVKRLKSAFCLSERMLKNYQDKRGYLRVKLCVNNKTKMHSIHKLVYESINGRIGSNMTINHIDCNKQNNNINNLEVCTRADNTKLATLNGRISLSGAKINQMQVEAIRQLKQKGVSSLDLSIMYSVSKRQIDRIASGENWKHHKKTSATFSTKDLL